jgi:hypothetical protein
MQWSDASTAAVEYDASIQPDTRSSCTLCCSEHVAVSTLMLSVTVVAAYHGTCWPDVNRNTEQ